MNAASIVPLEDILTTLGAVLILGGVGMVTLTFRHRDPHQALSETRRIEGVMLSMEFLAVGLLLFLLGVIGLLSRAVG